MNFNKIHKGITGLGGLVDNLHGGFGLVDNLYMTYEGNMLTSVCDSASHLPYASATDFDGVPGQEYPLAYNGAGSLVSDAGRGIARIDYDLNNNPVRIQFTNGSVTKRQEICEMRPRPALHGMPKGGQVMLQFK